MPPAARGTLFEKIVPCSIRTLCKSFQNSRLVPFIIKKQGSLMIKPQTGFLLLLLLAGTRLFALIVLANWVSFRSISIRTMAKTNLFTSTSFSSTITIINEVPSKSYCEKLMGNYLEPKRLKIFKKSSIIYTGAQHIISFFFCFYNLSLT